MKIKDNVPTFDNPYFPSPRYLSIWSRRQPESSIQPRPDSVTTVAPYQHNQAAVYYPSNINALNTVFTNYSQGAQKNVSYTTGGFAQENVIKRSGMRGEGYTNSDLNQGYT